MSEPGFAPIERSLQEALRSWFAAHPDRDDAAAEATIATNSTALADRAEPLVAMLERGGVGSLEGLSVLDLGCGFGGIAVYLAWRGARVVGIDPGRSRLAVGRAAAGEHGLDVELRTGRMEAIEAPDASFDVALMNNTLCYVIDGADRRVALSEARRVLREGGTLAIREPNGLHPLDHFTRIPFLPLLPPAAAARVAAVTGGHRPDVRLVTPRALRRSLLDAGFADVRHDPGRPGALRTVARPVARYQHFTARRAR